MDSLDHCKTTYNLMAEDRYAVSWICILIFLLAFLWIRALNFPMLIQDSIVPPYFSVRNKHLIFRTLGVEVLPYVIFLYHGGILNNLEQTWKLHPPPTSPQLLLRTARSGNRKHMFATLDPVYISAIFLILGHFLDPHICFHLFLLPMVTSYSTSAPHYSLNWMKCNID